MSMDTEYQNLHETAKQLRFHAQDALDEPGHSAAQRLMDEVKELVVDYEQQKSPRNIENRLKVIIGLLDQAKSGGQTFMSVSDAMNYRDRYEDMRREIRGRHDYA